MISLPGVAPTLSSGERSIDNKITHRPIFVSKKVITIIVTETMMTIGVVIS